MEAADHWPGNRPLLLGRYSEADSLHATVIGLPCHQGIPFRRMQEIADKVAALVENARFVFTGARGLQTV